MKKEIYWQISYRRNRGSISDRGKRFFFIPDSRRSSIAHPAGDSLPGVNRQSREADYSPNLLHRQRIRKLYLHSTLNLHDVQQIGCLQMYLHVIIIIFLRGLDAFLFFIDFRLCSSSSSEFSSVSVDGVEAVSGSSLSFCGEFVHHRFLECFIHFWSSILLISMVSLFVRLRCFNTLFSKNVSVYPVYEYVSRFFMCFRKYCLSYVSFCFVCFKVFFTRVL
jgi:hypothetical protein